MILPGMAFLYFSDRKMSEMDFSSSFLRSNGQVLGTYII